MKYIIFVLLCVIGSSSIALASDFIYNDGVAANGGGVGFVDYIYGQDASNIVCTTNCNMVPKANVAQQQAFMTSLNDKGIPRFNDPRKLKVVSGLAVDRVAGDITAINNADTTAAAAKAAEDAKLAAAAGDASCTAQSIDDIVAAIESARSSALAEITTARAAAHTQINGLASNTLTNMQLMGNGMTDKLYDSFNTTTNRMYNHFAQVMKCVYAKAKLTK